MSVRRLPTFAAGLGLLALAWPAASAADHIVTSATVSARLKERRSADFWTVEINWTAACNGAASGAAWFDARNGRRELVRCGSGRDRARLDHRDRARSCECISRPG